MRKSATRFRKQSELTHILGLILRVATEIMICEKRVKVKKDQFGGGKGGKPNDGKFPSIGQRGILTYREDLDVV